MPMRHNKCHQKSKTGVSMILLPNRENAISVGKNPTKSVIIRAILIYCGKVPNVIRIHPSIKYSLRGIIIATHFPFSLK